MIVDSNNNFNGKYRATVSPKFSRHPRMDYQRTTVFCKVTEIEIQGFLSQVSVLCKFFTCCMQKSCFLYTVWIPLSSLFPKWWHVYCSVVTCSMNLCFLLLCIGSLWWKRLEPPDWHIVMAWHRVKEVVMEWVNEIP